MPVKNNNQPVFARPLAGRGNPEDWSTFAHAATPSFTAGYMSPMKRGKCREATKGGATLPKVATVVSLLRNDVVHIGKAYDSL